MRDTNLLTTKQVAKLLGVGPIRVADFARQGRLGVAMRDRWGYYWFDEAEVERFRKIPRKPGRPDLVST